MQICVTGARGFVGRNLVEVLSRQGHSIRVLTRQAVNTFPAAIQVVIGDLTRPDCRLDSFVKDCDVLFHCAGELRDVNAMRPLHVEGIKRLLDAVEDEYARAGKTVRWVQLSSVGAYGPPAGKPETDRVVTEKTAARPANEYEITKNMADELVMQAGVKSGAMTYCILRPSNIFGAKMTNQSLCRLILAVRRGIFFYIGQPGAIATYVHVADVVAALIVCATESRAKDQIYNLSQDCKLEDLIKHIAARLGVKTPWLRIPGSLILIPVGLLSGLLKRWLRIPNLDVLVLRTRYPTGKIEAELRFNFSKRMPAAIEDLLLEVV